MSSGMLQASLLTVRIDVPGIDYSADIQTGHSCFIGMGSSNFAFAPANSHRNPIYKTHVTIGSGSDEEKAVLVITRIGDEDFSELQILLPPAKLADIKNEMQTLPFGDPKLCISMSCEDAVVPTSFGNTIYLPQDGDKNIWGTACKLRSIKLIAVKQGDIKPDGFLEKHKLALCFSFLAGFFIATLLSR